MAFTISYVYEAIDNFSSVARRINTSIKHTTRLTNGLNRHFKGFSDRMGRFGLDMGLRIAAPLALAGKYALSTAANFQQMQMSMEAFLKAKGSAVSGKQFFQELVKFTAKTPFHVRDMVMAAKNLMQYGIGVKRIIPLLRQLGDVAAGTTGHLSDILLPYTEVLGMGKLQGRQLRMLRMRGANVAGIIEKHFHLTAAEFTKLQEKGAISSKVFMKAFEQLSAKGGIFYQHMKIYMHSIMGLYTTLQDNFAIASSYIGFLIVKSLKLGKIIPELSIKMGSFGDKLHQWTKQNPKIAKFSVYLGVAVIALTSMALVLASIGFLISVAFTPFTIAAIAIAAMGFGLYKAYKYLMQFKNAAWAVHGIIHGIIIAIKFMGKAINAALAPFRRYFTMIKFALTELNKLIGYARSSTAAPSNIMGTLFPSTSALMHHTASSANVNVHIRDKGKNVSHVTSSHFGIDSFNLGLYNSL